MSSEQTDKIDIDTSGGPRRTAIDRIHSKATAWLFLGLSIPLFFFSVGWAVKGIGDVRSAFKRANLPQVAGKVIRSSVTTGALRLATVEYEYAVNGVVYPNEWTTRVSDEVGEEIVRRFPVGETITVAYWPNNPKVSLLHHQAAIGLSDFSDLCIGIVLAFSCLPLGLRSIRKLRRHNESCAK